MNLKELQNLIRNDYDKKLINRMSKDTNENLNNYIANVVCDLINFISIYSDNKTEIIENLKLDKNICISNISIYVSLIPYIQLELKDNKNVALIANNLIEILANYIVGYLSKGEFYKSLINIKDILKISDEFYNGLLNYFEYNKLDILIKIDKNIK